MIALGKHPGLICKGAQPVDVYVGGHPVAPGITLDDYPLQEASGSVVTCEPVTGYKLGVTSTISAVQEGEGEPSPDNVRPIAGWDQVCVTRCGRNLLSDDFAEYERPKDYHVKRIKLLKGATYTLRCVNDDGITGCAIILAKSGREYPLFVGKSTALSPNGTAATQKITVDDSYTDPHIAYYLATGVTAEALFASCKPQLELGDTATEYEPYTGDTYTRDLPSTIYGGTIDWVTGVLTVTHGCIDSYAGEAVPDGWISSTGQLSEGAQVVHPLATPYTIQLTPQQIAALEGSNNIYTDSGDTAVTYRIRKTS